jgi:2-polyprenyl-3-methyl-5-hydroxy-6-metoxy-1,4-benzoquinol methylase
VLPSLIDYMGTVDGDARPRALTAMYAARGVVASWRQRNVARRGLADSSCSQAMHADERLRLALVRERGSWLERLCAETAPGEVAHIGCTASPYMEERLAAETLLHQRFVKLAPMTGFDIDADALELLRKALPRERFVLADVGSTVPESERGRYQLVVAGEVLEHVPDADAFLRGCRRLLLPGGRLCVTVPNACAPKIGVRSLAGREVVHPDHRTYYSPRTLARTLRGAGFEPESVASYLAPVGTTSGLAYHLVVRTAHRIFQGPVGEGLIAMAKVQV